jgi:hypothetical protein
VRAEACALTSLCPHTFRVAHTCFSHGLKRHLGLAHTFSRMAVNVGVGVEGETEVGGSQVRRRIREGLGRGRVAVTWKGWSVVCRAMQGNSWIGQVDHGPDLRWLQKEAWLVHDLCAFSLSPFLFHLLSAHSEPASIDYRE